jgi:hypothetical protein
MPWPPDQGQYSCYECQYRHHGQLPGLDGDIEFISVNGMGSGWSRTDKEYIVSQDMSYAE